MVQLCLNSNFSQNITNLFIHKYIYIYIYIYCHPQTQCFVASQLFSVTRHVVRLKPAQLNVRLSIIPLSQQANYISSGIIRHYVVAFVCLHFCLTGYQSAQFIQTALLYASGSRKFLRQSYSVSQNRCDPLI